MQNVSKDFARNRKKTMNYFIPPPPYLIRLFNKLETDFALANFISVFFFFCNLVLYYFLQLFFVCVFVIMNFNFSDIVIDKGARSISNLVFFFF